MKPISFFICLHFWAILIPVYAQDFRTVQDGIEYSEVTRKIDNLPVRMNLLRLDLTKVRLDVVHAIDSVNGTETVSSMATRYGAIAAINAGFFKNRGIYAGDPSGVLMIDNVLLSESYRDRIAVFIKNESDRTNVEFDYPKFLPFLVLNETEISVELNRERKDDDLVLYTPEFNRTTLTDNNGVEVTVRDGRIVRIQSGRGSSAIPGDGFVISASGIRRGEILNVAKVGDKTLMSYRMSTRIKEPFEDIVGGVPLLVKKGKIEITREQEKTSKEFTETKNPRTAVANLKDGKFLMITIDGRSEVSSGINLQSLAEILSELGAVDAINLDGGGSTTMFLNGKIVNQPSDKEGERKVSDAILVFPRKLFGEMFLLNLREGETYLTA